MAGEARRLGGNGMSVDEWLGLDEVDKEVIEYGVMLAREIRRRREASGLTQAEFGARIGRSQASIAKAECGLVGIGRMLAILFATGVKASDLAVAGK